MEHSEFNIKDYPDVALKWQVWNHRGFDQYVLTKRSAFQVRPFSVLSL